MASQIISRQMVGNAVGSGTDQVVAFVPLPPGTRLNNVWLDVSVRAIDAMTIDSAVVYGMSGFVVDVEDPDTSQNYDAIWDMMIAKDVPEGFNILSIDTATADLQPEFEPGQLDLFQVFGDNLLGNMQIYQRRELLTYPKRPVGYDASNDTWFPMDAFKIHIKNGPRVSRPSVAMFGITSPSMESTQAYNIGAIGATPTEQEWIITMYAEIFLYDMWKHLIGVTPAADTAPFDAVSAWFAKLLEDKMWETGTNAFVPSTLITHTKTTWDISVVGKPGKVALTSD